MKTWRRNHSDYDDTPESEDILVRAGIDPEAMGYDARRLAALSRAIVRHDIPTEAMVVVVGGKVIFTYGDVSRPAELSSCWTGLLSILYGRFVQMKRIDLDETLESIGITDNVKLERRERSAKVRDLIASRSGCYIAASNDPPPSECADGRQAHQVALYAGHEPAAYLLFADRGTRKLRPGADLRRGNAFTAGEAVCIR